MPIEIPERLAASHAAHFGDAGRAWTAALPVLAAGLLERWELRRAGPVRCGAVALVLPVHRADGTAAVLKLQPVDEETRGEPAALRAWGGDGAVRLLAEDPDSGALLLERLDADRSLEDVPDVTEATLLLAGLLARLVTVPPPPGLRRLGDLTARMLRETPGALPRLAGARHRALLLDCAAAVREVSAEPGGQLLHWDLHYGNVLAPLPAACRERWLVIDPKPLVGDPGFELLPALRNRFAELTAHGDPRRAVRRRFDLMTEVLGLDRERAAAWTLGRVLQNTLWALTGGASALSEAEATIADALRYGSRLRNRHR
ncbi:aminoglycoside phosphotransferase family protein [Streptomyces sp. ACA25]|uniref:aminoglycoside phosphotransferase family protein n=1 Tax=Streptomyces sp. ACA25 TaxID=3022596 RepID=UPI002306EBBF|nr:aminoglycoside phosphotransferase family protein [Streptomyces sp. ACA25]MDB1088075.1 aminoglycoside phosphotransferase family protein [Streptomyces sp. ACA25]